MIRCGRGISVKPRRKMMSVAVAGLLSVSLAACGTAQPAAEPNAQPQQPAAPETSKEAWEVEFDRVYEEAKKEGELIVYGQPGTNREDLMREFEKAYPGIKVKYTGMRSNEASAKLIAEQAQGKFLADIQIEGAEGGFEDAREFIIDPGLKDDSIWHGGFEAGFKALEGSAYEGRYVYGLLASPTIYINNDVIPEGEIKTIEDIIDPKWKGQLLIKDFSRFGQSTSALGGLVHQQGQEYMHKLLENEPILGEDDRQNVQWFLTGRYPIAIGLDTTQLDTFKESGVTAKIQRLRQEKATFYTPFSLGVLKNPPHPNATKVFIHWYFSKEGQEHFVDKLNNYLSRRVDVKEPESPESIPWAQIDIENAMAYYSKEGLEITNWVIEQGKAYKLQMQQK